MNKPEPRGTLQLNLLRGKDVKADGTAKPCLFVKIKVGSDTSWTETPALSYLAPTFGKKFTGFNVRQSVIVEFQVINRNNNVDTIVGKGSYPIKSITSKNEVVYVPLKPAGYLEVEMGYVINEPGQEIKAPVKRPMPQQRPQQIPAGPVQAPIARQQMGPMPYQGMQAPYPFYVPVQPGVVKPQPFPQYYPGPNYPQQMPVQQVPQIPQMIPAFPSNYQVYPQAMQPVQYPNFKQ